MSIGNRQIGWGQESNLLWQISKQLDRTISILTCCTTTTTSTTGIPTTTTTTTVAPTTTTTTTVEPTTTTTTSEPFSGLKFTYTEGNVPASMELYLTFANGYSILDVTQDIVGNSIILTGAIDQITEIDVNGQVELTEIDGLVNCTSLEYLSCSGCTGLSVLPTLPDSLTDLYCSGCTGLSVLPALPASLTTLSCFDCTGLSVLPALPASLTGLSCYGCNLTAIEMDANAIELDTNGLSNGYWFWSPQANLAEPNQTAAAYLSLIVKGWSFVE